MKNKNHARTSKRESGEKGEEKKHGSHKEITSTTK
jgi:hypothetical protein